MSKSLSFDKEQWFDVTLYLDEAEIVADVWLDEIESRISSLHLDFVKETFLRAGLRAYRLTYGKKFSAKEVYIKAGYSKSTFHRMFDTFPAYQLKIYHFIADMAVDIYADCLERKERTPEEFCRFTRDCIYSSHLAAPKSIVADVYRINSPITPERFHPYVPKTSEVMYEYIRQRRDLGYGEFSKDGLTEVIRTLDYDILFSKVNDCGVFPNIEQANRLERMLLAYII